MTYLLEGTKVEGRDFELQKFEHSFPIHTYNRKYKNYNFKYNIYENGITKCRLEWQLLNLKVLSTFGMVYK